ncbi:chaplin [Catenulispora subtropica]|uniref:Chaplin domain-containing protein n=1 Tax=Catenulispora subtropica TaxID=450798 RepID=A0ABN2RWZ6_9ACTN
MQSQVKRRIAFGLTTGGLLAGGGLGFAHADAAGPGSGASGTAGGSPGILSGNSVQIPVDIPINVCGVTANVVGLLNPAAHNGCSNTGGAPADAGSTAAGGTTATGGAHGSPGILSGNNVQVPVDIPVNACGDSVDVVGVGNTAAHNHCANHGGATATGGSGTGSAGGSPGILSGNNVQVPVHIPVNVCGDTVDVVGVGNTAAHNHCANHGGAVAIGGSGQGTTAGGSPGILSGNSIQIPIDIPVNVCGDSVDVVGVGDSALHNGCANHGGAVAAPPPSTPPTTPPPGPNWPGGTKPRIPGGETPGSLGSQTPPPGATGALAHTGADGLMLAPVGAALIGGGAFLYRKFKPESSH